MKYLANTRTRTPIVFKVSGQRARSKVVRIAKVTNPMTNWVSAENQRNGRNAMLRTRLRTLASLEMKRGRGLIVLLSPASTSIGSHLDWGAKWFRFSATEVQASVD